ncbi:MULTISPECIES: hypothetical protein [unclassified Eikenella]|uniref:hypothetical protein n=1 Tax=unclassified Eikenella TaxID=2639367 RepID=UPI000A405138|nr:MULTISPECIES: hypothetical protein [unclassified Eikenella]
MPALLFHYLLYRFLPAPDAGCPTATAVAAHRASGPHNTWLPILISLKLCFQVAFPSGSKAAKLITRFGIANQTKG